MSFNKDNKEEKDKMISTSKSEEGKISQDAATAIESGIFEDKKDELEGKAEDNADKDEEEKEDKKKRKKRKNPFASRNFRKGSFAVVFTCIVIVAVIVLNILVNVIQSKVPSLSIDMSGQNLYELSESSKEFVRSIDEEVTIAVLAPEDIYTQADTNFNEANILLKKYTAENDKIKIEYIDLSSNPTYINNYPNENITSYSYIVSCGDKYKYLDVSNDLFTIGYDASTGSSYVESSNVESAVTSAIYFVTSDNQTKVAVLNGFSSDSDSDSSNLSTFTSLLKSNNYEVEEINLMTEDIPEDASIAILYQPTADLTEEAVDRISNYLSNNAETAKNLFYVPPYIKVDSPNIDSLLEEWGMSIGQGLVADTDSSYMPYPGDYYCSVYDYNGDTYTDGLKDNSKYLIGAYLRPVIIEDTSKVTALAMTSQSSALRSFDADDDWDPSEHIEGSFNAGAVSTRTGDNANSNLIVWGSELSFNTAFLNSSTFNNSDYFVNLFNTVTDREDSGITIESKSKESTELGIMSDQINVLGPIFTYVIPVLTIIVGLVIWIRRRHK